MTSPAEGIELSVVIPVHNEAATIESVIRETIAVAEELAPAGHEVVVVDDGSTDDTVAITDRLADELASVTVVHLVPNGGHGPALLAGFDRATGAWIAHLDSDDQIGADQLAVLWPERLRAPLVLGIRAQRHDPRYRLVISSVLRAMVSRLAGCTIRDANVPCKIVSRRVWNEVRPLLPDDTFAPSVLLALAAARRGEQILQVEVEHRARAHGVSSLRPLRLIRSLALSTAQMLGLVRRTRHR